MRWKGAAAAFLIAQSAWADTITAGSQGFSVEIDTSEACVIVPPNRQTEMCRRADPIPTTLPAMAGQDARFVFLASMPLRGAARYWLGIIQLTPPAKGLTGASYLEMQRALRAVTAREGDFEVSQPSASEVATTGGIDRAAVSYEAWPRADPGKRYASSFALYFGSEDYVVQTFCEARNAAAVDLRTNHQLETVHVPPRVKSTDPDAAFAAINGKWNVIPNLLIGVAFLVLAAIVVRDTARLRSVKPKRDSSTANLKLYDRARGVGILAALTLIASVGFQWAAYCVDSPSTAKVLAGGASLLSWAAVAPLLIWVYRVVANARALGCTGVMTASMAVTWFVVPAASLYYPFRAISEVAAASRRRRDGTATIWLVAVWWLAFVASIAVRLMDQRGVASWLRLCVALAAWTMVVALDHDQEHLRRKIEKSAAATPSSSDDSRRDV